MYVVCAKIIVYAPMRIHIPVPYNTAFIAVKKKYSVWVCIQKPHITREREKK